MIQQGTYLNVIDNSGAKTVYCIKVLSGYRRRYAFIGDVVIVSVKDLRLKKRNTLKIKKGDILKALIIRSKVVFKSYFFESLKFFDNAVILLNLKNKFIGTRIFGSVPKFFRYTKYLRILSLSAGLIC